VSRAWREGRERVASWACVVVEVLGKGRGACGRSMGWDRWAQMWKLVVMAEVIARRSLVPGERGYSICRVEVS
jgi:hypothetical protein